MKTYILNGKGGSGKDLFVEFFTEYVKEKYDISCYNISSVDGIKKIAKKHFGWNDEKTSDWRKMLSDLKDIQTKGCDGPFNYMKDKLEYYDSRIYATICFLHIREPDEIERCKNEFLSKTILIKRFDESTSYGNHADDNVGNYDYDFVIENFGTLEEFKTKVIEFAEKQWLTK